MAVTRVDSGEVNETSDDLKEAPDGVDSVDEASAVVVADDDTSTDVVV